MDKISDAIGEVNLDSNDPAEQTHKVMQNIEQLIIEAGGEMKHLVKIDVVNLLHKIAKIEVGFESPRPLKCFFNNLFYYKFAITYGLKNHEMAKFIPMVIINPFKTLPIIFIMFAENCIQINAIFVKKWICSR